MHVQLSQVVAFASVCGAILAGAAVVALLVKVVRSVFRLVKRAGKFFDQWFGDREAGTLSMPERLTMIAEQVTQQGHRLDEHLTWHSAAEHPNGGSPRRVAPASQHHSQPRS